jgi:hypothetical protein
MDTLREALLRAALPGPLSLDNAEEGHAALFPAVPAADFHAAIATPSASRKARCIAAGSSNSPRPAAQRPAA